MVMNAIINRKSVRKYSDKPISDDVIRKIVDAGRLAPSWVNVQPWKFVVVKSQEVKDLLSEASGGQKQVKTAQVVICCVADLAAWEKTNFGKVLQQKGLDEQTIDGIVSSNLLNPSTLGEYETLLRSVEQLTYAVSYMTLEAEELGVGCCVVGAMANELTKTSETMAQQVKEVLGLSNKQVLVDLITLGYEDKPVPTKKLRKDFDQVVFYDKIN
jgi:nitroreductase